MNFTEINQNGGVEGFCLVKSLEIKKTVLAINSCNHECDRCLECNSHCENCVTVCPNRANIAIKTKNSSMPQILHVDIMCNECGNCATFCPYTGAPYLDKLTLFADEKGMADSENNGFYMVDEKNFVLRLFGNKISASLDDMSKVPSGIADIINAVCSDYSYLL